LNNFPGTIALAGGFLNGFNDFGIINQTINQNLSFGQLKRLDLNIQAGADFIDHAIDPSSDKPA
jgi:hypothetical protein